MEKIRFDQMPFIRPIQQALVQTGYVYPTPIQQKAIPLILANHDLLGIAQTGTGKTAAFCLPIIQKLYTTAFKPKPNTPRALILAPTRELALQIQKDFETYSAFSKLTSAVVFGGVSQVPQVEKLRQGIDILVATTGRLLDLVNQRYINLEKIEILVLDEADRMLDMGFFPDINKILGIIPKQKQSLLFSATMPKEVQTLAHKLLKDPKKVEVTPESKTADRVKQSVVYVDKEHKLDLLFHLLKDPALKRVMLFIDMKHVANRVTEKLIEGRVSAAAIHSDKSQGARQRALEDFKSGKIRVLVATDIAARGIDIDGITHVINYDLSHLVENYVHRIGRTARAGASGEAITFCGSEEKSFLYAVEKTTGVPIEVLTDMPYFSERVAQAQVVSVGKAKAILEAKRIENKLKRGHQSRGAPRRKFSEKSGGGSSGGGRKSGGGSGRSSKGGGRSR